MCNIRIGQLFGKYAQCNNLMKGGIKWRLISQVQGNVPQSLHDLYIGVVSYGARLKYGVVVVD